MADWEGAGRDREASARARAGTCLRRGRDAIRHNEGGEIDSFVRGGALGKQGRDAPDQTPLSCHPRSQPTAAHRGREGALSACHWLRPPRRHTRGPMIRLSCPSIIIPAVILLAPGLARLKRAICVFPSSPPPRRSLASEDACTYQDAPPVFLFPFHSVCLMTILIQQSLRPPWPYI